MAISPYREPGAIPKVKPVPWTRRVSVWVLRFVRSPARIATATLTSFVVSWALAIFAVPLGYPDLAMALFGYPMAVTMLACVTTLLCIAGAGLRDWIAAEDAERKAENAGHRARPRRGRIK